MDEELRIALSKKEKVELFLSNLEQLREDDSVTDAQYQDLKAEYTVIQEEVSAAIKSIKARLRKEFEKKAEELEGAQREQELWQIRFNVGEVRSETYWAQVKPLRKKIAQLKKEVPKLQTLLNARSTAEIGGPARVNIPELKVKRVSPKPRKMAKPIKKSETPTQSPEVAEQPVASAAEVREPPSPSRDKAFVSELLKESPRPAAPKLPPSSSVGKASAGEKAVGERKLAEYPSAGQSRTSGKLAAIVVGAVVVLVIIIFAIGRAVSTPPDSSPPVISGFAVSNITGASATIEWITNEKATSQVTLRDPLGTSISVERDKDLVTKHAVKVSGIKLGVKYRLIIKSADGAGNEAVYETDQVFMGAAQAGALPVISNVSISDITDTGAVVTWNTDRPATSQVMVTEAGAATPSLTEPRTELTTSHSVTLTNLKPSVTYTITLIAKDAGGNQTMYDTGKTLTTLAASSASPEVGKRAPDFTLSTVDGKSLTLSSFRGKVVMVRFWQRACPACVREMPMIQSVFPKLPADKAVILAVNTREDEATVRSFKERWNLTFPILLDPKGKVASDYKVDDIPVTFLLNSQGVIKEIKVGAFQSAEEIAAIINSLLAGGR